MSAFLEELSEEILREQNFSKMYCDIANAKYESGNYEHAIIACQQSLQINPNQYFPLFLQGQIYSFKNDYPLSIFYFSKALKVKKTFNLFLQRGISKFKLNDYKDALNDFKEAISLNPEYTPSYYFMADCKYELENYASAVLDLNFAIGLSDKQNRIDKSLNKMDEFFAHSGDDLLYELRALCKYEMDYFKDAIEDFNEAIEIKPTDDLCLYHRAQCKYELEDNKGALFDLDNSLKLDPSYYGFCLRGDVKIKLEDYRGAIEDFNKAIEINPNFYLDYQSRGECKLNLKQYKGAIEDFNKAIEINPENEESIKLRKQCMQKLDDISDAFINSLLLKLNV